MNIVPVALDTDGCVIWRDAETGERWNGGELPTDSELAEIGGVR